MALNVLRDGTYRKAFYDCPLGSVGNDCRASLYTRKGVSVAINLLDTYGTA